MTPPRLLVAGAALALLALAPARPGRAEDPGPAPSGEGPPPEAGASAVNPDGGARPERPGLSGLLDLESRWSRAAIVRAGGSGSRSDLYVRKVELAVEAPLLHGVNAIAVLSSEWIGDGLNAGDGALGVDEVHLDLEGRHAYLAAGLRSQPFGVFDNPLVTEPLTQDAYEIKKPGVTLGARGPQGLDLSLTAYAGGALWEHFTSSRLLDAAALARQPLASDRISSCVLTAALAPWDGRLNLSGALDSEPGAGRRNTTANAALQLAPHGSNHLLLDGEVMWALSREAPAGAPRAFKERAGSFSAAYAFTFRPRSLRGGGNYRARRAQRHAHPVLVGVRQEFLDDDGLSAARSIATVRQRTSLGGRYTFADDRGRTAYVSAEYRRTQRRVPAQEPFSRRGHEGYLRLGIDF